MPGRAGSGIIFVESKSSCTYNSKGSVIWYFLYIPLMILYVQIKVSIWVCTFFLYLIIFCLERLGYKDKDDSKAGDILFSFWNTLTASPTRRVVALAYLRFVQKSTEYMYRLMFTHLRPEKADPLPPLTNPILLQSAQLLSYKIRKRELSSEQVVRAFIYRIKQVNPFINAVIEERFLEAMEEAREVDRLIASAKLTAGEAQRKPFLGIPFTVKCNFAIEGMHQTAGVYSKKNTEPEKHADTVRLMCEAGAIPLAITNTSELCVWWDTYNTLYGETRNPYNTTRSAGGSSGGEAAIISAAGSVFGLATDLGGSIRAPCHFSGIFGHKPSQGTTSCEGTLPKFTDALLAYNAVGPLCRYASDLAPACRVLMDQYPGKLKLDTKVNIGQLKVYYMEDDGGSLFSSPVDPEIKEAIHKAVNYLKATYNVTAIKVSFEQLKYSSLIYMVKIAMAIQSTKYDFLEELVNKQGKINPLWEILKAPFGLSQYTAVAVITGLLARMPMQVGGKLDTFVTEQLEALKKDMEKMLNPSSVFLYPTTAGLAPYLYQTVFSPMDIAYSSVFNILNFPATHCPMGLSSKGLPIGFQIIGGLYQDHLTIALAEHLERGFGGWVCPSDIR